MKIVLSSNSMWNLYNFRYGLIKNLIKKGFQIIIIAPKDSSFKELIKIGCCTKEIKMNNQGVNPFSDFKLFINYLKIYLEIKPDFILHFTIKPTIYGSFVASLLGIKTINTITGLGTIFLKNNFITQIVKTLYILSQRKVIKIFFQNNDDKNYFLINKLVKNSIVDVIPGSGVNIEKFIPKEYPNKKKIVFLFIGRIIYDKGIKEFIDAIQDLKKNYSSIEFQLLGEISPKNISSIPKERIINWEKKGLIKYVGFKKDVRPFIEKAHCIVLPSYREGMPRSLLEAMSMSRPVIATNVEGCREIVDDGKNGFLCETKNYKSLSQVMKKFLSLTRTEQKALGQNGRNKILHGYDEKYVIEKYLDLLVVDN